ncbi:MAG: LLM class flavin-dependent oxidoreductase [Herpetosiphonaceae bacterium]|nr:LLM class flavin-dependent oxidoreductase [Herpetosiphonaceae bacterium]
MAKPIEFGFFGPTGSEKARGHAFAPALQRAIAIARDSFSSLWFADHFMFGEEDIHEAWTVLGYAAALAPELQLGHLVSCNSYRPPALVAKMSASLQSLSGGRFVLGYGAGWHKEEYLAYGYDFPSAATRIAMMEEGLQVIKAMWHDEQPSFQGRYYHIEHARCEPRPQPVPPIMIGGDGEQRTLRAVARHADWWNIYNRQADVARHKLEVLAEHCKAEGRDFASIRKSWAGPVIIDRDHHAAMKRAAERNLTGDRPPIAGDPVAVTEQIQALVELGFDLFQVESSQFPDTADIELFAERVMPAFR